MGVSARALKILSIGIAEVKTSAPNKTS